MEEREHFLEIFNQFAVNDNDSSDMDAEKTRNFYKKDNGVDLAIGDKVYVIEGELQKAYGQIVNFDQGGSNIVFKPLNLDGFTDNLDIERKLVVKYFEQGDAVRIIDGKYQGETGVVMNVDDNNVLNPTVKIDSTQRELQINTNNLKSGKGTDKNDIKLGKKRAQAGNPQPSVLTLGAQKNSEVFYKVGDLINFEGGRVNGYIIEAEPDNVKVVSDTGEIRTVRVNQIDKKIPFDKRNMSRDSKGNALQIDDVVKVVNRNSYCFGKTGIIKNISKNCLFLWDRSFQQRSFGIYVEQAKNVKIQGSEFIQQEPGRHGLATVNLNRIQKDKLLNKSVLIISGPFKGQRGRVIHMNGDRATVETSLRSKTPQIHLHRTELKEIGENDQVENQQYQDQHVPADTYGGQTTYAGGQTAYDIGKTPMALNTPSYFPQSPRDGGYGDTAGGYGGQTRGGDRDDYYDPNRRY